MSPGSNHHGTIRHQEMQWPCLGARNSRTRPRRMNEGTQNRHSVPACPYKIKTGNHETPKIRSPVPQNYTPNNTMYFPCRPKPLTHQEPQQPESPAKNVTPKIQSTLGRIADQTTKEALGGRVGRTCSSCRREPQETRIGGMGGGGGVAISGGDCGGRDLGGSGWGVECALPGFD